MKLIFSTIVFCLFLSSCLAQKVDHIGEELTKTTVRIYNNSESKKVILVGSITKLDTFEVAKNSTWLSPSYKFNPIVKIRTQDKIVTYKLKIGRFYMIYWKKNKERWDLKRIKNR
ncbi:MAG: hypothetical protein WBG90_07320 [Saonia sp.]